MTFRLKALCLLAALGLPAAGAVLAADEWAVKDAVLCFTMQVRGTPSEPSAGLVGTIPDGGILPKPAVELVVLDATGKELKSEVIWHDPQEGVGFVFEPPAGQQVKVYVRPAARYTTAPELQLHPSLLLLTRPGGDASLEAAQKLGAAFPILGDSRGGLVDLIGQMDNPFGPNDD